MQSIQKPVFDELDAFARWYLGTVGPVPYSPIEAVSKVGPFTGLVLYRDGQFQAQLWICDPNSEIPSHCHPNVDSLQIYVAGQVYLTLNGEQVVKPEDVRETAEGVIARSGFCLRVRPTDYHGAQIGPAGGAFMTIQRWLDGKPKSVELDWEGDPVDTEHKEKLDAAAA